MRIPIKIMSLIKKYAALNPDKPEEYIFPFYSNTMSEKQKLRKRKSINRAIDWSLKDICNNLNIQPITTYWARHTIATKLYNDGKSPAVISRLLGHSSIKTTDTYLGQLNLKTQNDVATSVSSFLEDLSTDKAKPDYMSREETVKEYRRKQAKELERMATEPLE